MFDVYMFCVYNMNMIKSFADTETRKIYDQRISKKLPVNIQKIALRKLIMIDNAYSLQDLRVPPRNRLEQLYGNRSGQHSIRINDQYRICFRYYEGDFWEVEIVDYH